MGYCYCARTGRLACDACGTANGKVRKRTCPHRIVYADGGSAPYCSPPALCPECYATHRPTLHVDCKDGAARAMQREAERGARFASGDFEVRTAWGAGPALGTSRVEVPAGLVGVRFANRAGAERFHLLAKDRYAGQGWLSDYAPAELAAWDAKP